MSHAPQNPVDTDVPLNNFSHCHAGILRHLDTFGELPALLAPREGAQGRAIVNTASITGVYGNFGQGNYAAAKAGVIGLTRDLAQQWGARKGIRVNAIAPGFFESEMTDTYAPGYIESQMPRVLLGRMGDPSELAATAIWLSSAAGGYVTGQTIAVDGGMTRGL